MCISRFLRDEDERPASWDDQLAAKYYASLYREFALCDLKHYKSGNVSIIITFKFQTAVADSGDLS